VSFRLLAGAASKGYPTLLKKSNSCQGNSLSGRLPGACAGKNGPDAAASNREGKIGNSCVDFKPEAWYFHVNLFADFGFWFQERRVD